MGPVKYNESFLGKIRVPASIVMVARILQLVTLAINAQNAPSLISTSIQIF